MWTAPLAFRRSRLKKFAAELRLMTGLTVDLFDERLSSYEARERLREAPAPRKRGKPLDAVAACVILESWMRNQKPCEAGSK